MRIGRFAAEIERVLGIPTVVIIRESFIDAVGRGFSAQGFSAEVTSVWETPHSVFYSDESDLTTFKENIDKIVYALTKWQPKVKELGIYPPGPNIKIQGKDLLEAMEKMNILFLHRLWGDGLPVTPATPERVAWIMTGTDLDPDYVLPGVGRVMNLGGIPTVKSLAILLAAAGGRPEYFPVMLGIAEVMLDTRWALGQMTGTTRSGWPAAVVNGTIGNEIRLNSGYGCMGPDPRHPANASIGRAIRFMMAILGGATAGIGTMSNFGGNRFTNTVVAEDEEGLPPDWPSLGQERGFIRGGNCVTVCNVGNWYCHNLSITSGGDAVLQSLNGMLAFLTTRGSSTTRVDFERPSGFICVPDGFAKLCSAAGWSKQDVKTWIAENCNRTTGKNPLWKEGICRTWTPPYVLNADQVMIAVCGGEQAQHSYIMNFGTKDSDRLTKPITLPAKAKWEALLAQAEKDLGPNPGHTA